MNESEIWMWNGNGREIFYENWLKEIWHNKFPTNNFYPDFIFSRGGFREYLPVMKANPNAYKIYYGAIFKKRFNPANIGDNITYNLVLADSRTQSDELLRQGYTVHKLLKPACENIFKPVKSIKYFDVVFIANAKQKAFKGHEWFLRQMKDTGLRILQIGNTDNELIKLASHLGLNITFTGWVPRKDVPELACSAKVGVCCSTGDSCPRIVPEMLAMNIPVVVRENSGLHIWNDYFDIGGGCVGAEDDNFVGVLGDVIKYYDWYGPNLFYHDNLRLELAVDRLVEDIIRSLPTTVGDGCR